MSLLHSNPFSLLPIIYIRWYRFEVARDAHTDGQKSDQVLPGAEHDVGKILLAPQHLGSWTMTMIGITPAESGTTRAGGSTARRRTHSTKLTRASLSSRGSHT